MGQLLALLIELYIFVIIGRILASWAIAFGNVSPYNSVVQFLHQATEPVLKPVREMLPPMGGFDLSPMIVVIVLQIVSSMLVNV